ncbi:sodium/solute symporter, putative [Ixodes scapularis]|uniref:Sodium/solute symporter, putative n=1 Tax=Ixodes scapularis TaxID=6945 RepID=B7PC64_IXOSC|nr:sodium/solute symporter, putative [Ixodes scapularis]|eukprot:XP_002409444.1 sodium/solute symporter, putative [Ixodes scapularis]
MVQRFLDIAAFHVPLVWSIVAIGITGTFYTALGGLRGVVWTDTLQGILILVCPLTILIKIAYDSTFQEGLNLRPITDINLRPYLFQASFDLTNDENVWANVIGLIAGHTYRMGMDQMVIQRYAAARSIADAQRTVLISTLLLVTSFFFLGSVAMALVFWYRDCDPLLSGAIRKIEQGAAVSVIITMALQLWAVLGKLLVGVHPPRMPVTLDNCPGNFTLIAANFTHAWLAQEESERTMNAINEGKGIDGMFQRLGIPELERPNDI